MHLEGYLSVRLPASSPSSVEFKRLYVCINLYSCHLFTDRSSFLAWTPLVELHLYNATVTYSFTSDHPFLLFVQESTGRYEFLLESAEDQNRWFGGFLGGVKQQDLNAKSGLLLMMSSNFLGKEFTPCYAAVNGPFFFVFDDKKKFETWTVKSRSSLLGSVVEYVAESEYDCKHCFVLTGRGRSEVHVLAADSERSRVKWVQLLHASINEHSVNTPLPTSSIKTNKAPLQAQNRLTNKTRHSDPVVSISTGAVVASREQKPPDFEEEDSCYLCALYFNLFSRRHHCRNCGRSVCHPCSTRLCRIPELGFLQLVRVCDTCYVSLTQITVVSKPLSQGVYDGSVDKPQRHRPRPVNIPASSNINVSDSKQLQRIRNDSQDDHHVNTLSRSQPSQQLHAQKAKKSASATTLALDPPKLTPRKRMGSTGHLSSVAASSPIVSGSPSFFRSASPPLLTNQASSPAPINTAITVHDPFTAFFLSLYRPKQRNIKSAAKDIVRNLMAFLAIDDLARMASVCVNWTGFIMKHYLKNRAFVIERARTGFDANARSRIWFYLSGTYRFMQAQPLEKRMQEFLMLSDVNSGDSKFEKMIQQDVGRTMVATTYFSDGAFRIALCNVLRAYSRYNTNVGYCQGMSYLVGFLLLRVGRQGLSTPAVSDPEEGKEVASSESDTDLSMTTQSTTFWLFCRVMTELDVASLFANDMPRVHVCLYQLDQLMLKFLPNLHAHLSHASISTDMYAVRWYITLFVSVVPFHCVDRIWDLFFAAGWPCLHQISLAFLSHCQSLLLRMEPVPLMKAIAKFPNIPGLDSDVFFSPVQLITVSQEFPISEQDLHELEVEYLQLKYQTLASSPTKPQSPAPKLPPDAKSSARIRQSDITAAVSERRQSHMDERSRRASTAHKISQPLSTDVLSNLEPHFNTQDAKASDFNSILSSAFADFRSAIRAPLDINTVGWRVSSQFNSGAGLKVWAPRHAKNAPSNVVSSFSIKATQRFTSSAADVARYLLSTCLRKMSNGDTVTLVDELDPFTQVWRVVVKPPTPLFAIGLHAARARDFCFVTRKKVLPDKTIVIVARSVHYSSCPPVNTCVRGKMRVLGWAIQDGTTQTGPQKYCQVTFVGSMDILGSVNRKTVDCFKDRMLLGLSHLAKQMSQV